MKKSSKIYKGLKIKGGKGKMATAKKNPLIVILGPTATGKSDLAVDLALQLQNHWQKSTAQKCEIISADSRQVYAGLDIGSGKITKKEMRGVTHHCLDIASPFSKHTFTVADFQKHASRAIEEIYSRGNIPILCGGTGFYIQSIVDGLVLPDIEPDEKLRKKLGASSTKRLIAILKKLDAKRLKEIDQNNRVRLIRAIEIASAMGSVPKLKKVHAYDTLIFGLDGDDAVLKEKIYKRILSRIKKGMINEACKLHANGLSYKKMRQFGLEYGLLADHLQGKLTREQFIERLNYDTWHYVKRQRAWFKRDERIVWLDIKQNKNTAKCYKKIINFL